MGRGPKGEVRHQGPRGRGVDLTAEPPDEQLLTPALAPIAARSGCLPWRRTACGGIAWVAPDPNAARQLRAILRDDALEVCLARSPAVLEILREERLPPALVVWAEESLPARDSVRGLGPGALPAFLLVVAGPLAMIAWLAGAQGEVALLGAAAPVFVTTMLRLAGAVALLRRPAMPPTMPDAEVQLVPRVSLIIALRGEQAIVKALIERLSRLSWPRDRLEVLLVTEDNDPATREAIAAARPPAWIRTLSVPARSVRTKPRALNYALAFAQGEIIGILDAEDAPAPDQLQVIARHFALAPPEVACLQGMLDIYNARLNYLSRCFAIEYARWFRVVLGGLAALRLPVPLGGTTVYFRREALEAVGGWDAHNVTEDADLGLRLARHGYRTELVSTVTTEECAAALGPWIRQRSRWLKGYMLTWAVHMRDPLRLWRDVGPRAFLAVQVHYLAGLAAIASAPFLALGWLSGAMGLLPRPGPALAVLLLGAQLFFWITAGMGVLRARRPELLPWIPLSVPYFPLATIALFQAAIEALTHPIHWHKTPHGQFGGADGPHAPRRGDPAPAEPTCPEAGKPAPADIRQV